MASRNLEKDKYFNRLEKEFAVIPVINNPQLRPYLELFQYVPENVFHQSLGTLVGFFKINDTSEDSAYVVNFLSSVVKKEFYANTKRAVSESVDASLRKINIALAEIARQGNINWLGKLDGAVCVFEKNSLHFSVCGNAKIFLIRNGAISEISTGLATEEGRSNPLKTFENVSSGRIELNDKLIIATDDLLRVFSLNELKKASFRFQREKFSQFIKTALINQLDMSGTIIVDIFEKTESHPERFQGERRLTEETSLNVFSEKAFAQAAEKGQRAKTAAVQETREQKEYTDEKTGHIYVKGEYEQEGKRNIVGLYLFIFKEKVVDSLQWLKSKSKRNFLFLLRKIKKLFTKKMSAETPSPFPHSQPPQAQKINIRESQIQKSHLKFTPLKKIAVFFQKALQKIRPKKEGMPSGLKETYPSISFPSSEEKLSYSPGQGIVSKIKYSSRKLLPSFSKIRTTFDELNYQQRLYVLLALIAIIVVPLILLQIQNKISNPPVQQTAQENINDPRVIFASEKNIHFIDNIQSLTALENSKHLLVLNDIVFVITPNSVAQWKEDTLKESQWPVQFGSISLIAEMKDLNLIFIFTDQNKIISFSPVSFQFKENNIQFPDNAHLSVIATYLTYLYALDVQNNQIYRYPRAEGGFGNRVDWLKEPMDLSDVSQMAIDENIYLVKDTGIVKLFKGTMKDFNLESTNVPLKISGIYTNSETENIYILDNENGRVIKYNKNGEFIAQYQNNDLKNAIDFVVDEKNNIAYFVTIGNLKSFGLQ